jgi:hypothetical protein
VIWNKSVLSGCYSGLSEMDNIKISLCYSALRAIGGG